MRRRSCMFRACSAVLVLLFCRTTTLATFSVPTVPAACCTHHQIHETTTIAFDRLGICAPVRFPDRHSSWQTLF